MHDRLWQKIRTAGIHLEQFAHDFVPLLKGEKPEWRKDFLYEYYEFPGDHSVRKHRGVRTERYKYIHYFEEPQEYELYDLHTDPDEDHNLYGMAGYEELTAQLRARLEELRRETDDHYVYHPSRVLRLKAIEVPAQETKPHG